MAEHISAQVISIKEEDLNYKEIKQKSHGEKTIIIYNEGHEPLIIDNISTGCKCTIVEHSISEIKAQESAAFLIVYDTKKLGDFRRSISIKSNAINTDKFGENTFYIQGKVIK